MVKDKQAEYCVDWTQVHAIVHNRSVHLQDVMKGATPCETGAGAVPAPLAMAAAWGGEAAELLEAAGEVAAGADPVACCMHALQSFK